jgi:hypothetical protein
MMLLLLLLLLLAMEQAATRAMAAKTWLRLWHPQSP